MKGLYALIFFFICSASCNKGGTAMTETTVNSKVFTYLALGDSYTIGEMVPPGENFPNQVQRMLRDSAVTMQPPRIIAKTGWTTDELETGITAAQMADPFLPSYDLVTLLIGVNNQYRGRPAPAYRPEFEELLRKAIRFAGNNPEHVVVLSIPDWGVTPFATGRDRDQIAAEIDAYNAENLEVSRRYGIHYINVTPWTREAASDNSLLTGDGLHPSGKEYQRWAKAVSDFFLSKI